MANKNLIPFPGGSPSAEEIAKAETERKLKLYGWADDLLKKLGFAARIAAAKSSGDLLKINFDADDVEVTEAIRDTLHPIGGKKLDFLVGYNQDKLKRVLKSRFAEMKKEREAELNGKSGKSSGQTRTNPAWSSKLKLTKHI